MRAGLQEQAAADNELERTGGTRWLWTSTRTSPEARRQQSLPWLHGTKRQRTPGKPPTRPTSVRAGHSPSSKKPLDYTATTPGVPHKASDRRQRNRPLQPIERLRWIPLRPCTKMRTDVHNSGDVSSSYQLHSDCTNQPRPRCWVAAKLVRATSQEHNARAGTRESECAVG